MNFWSLLRRGLAFYSRRRILRAFVAVFPGIPVHVAKPLYGSAALHVVLAQPGLQYRFRWLSWRWRLERLDMGSLQWERVGDYSRLEAALYSALGLTSQQLQPAPSPGPFLDGRVLPACLELGPPGWSEARNSLAVLHRPGGLWLDTHLEVSMASGHHQRPWIGIVHGGPAGLQEGANFQNSLSQCRGLFCLSRFHREQWVARVDVPVAALPPLTGRPQRYFDPEACRNNPQPVLQWTGQLGPSPDYDRLLAAHLVHLPDLNGPGLKVLWQCAVRNTPVWVARTPLSEEILGADYPMYGSPGPSLRWQTITRTWHYLQRLSKIAFSPGLFLRGLVYSEAYQRLSPSPRKFMLIAHPRSGSSALRELLQEHSGQPVDHEPFQRGKSEVRCFATLEARLHQVFGRSLGFKHLTRQLPEELNRYLLRSGLPLVFLLRRNLLQAVVSDLIARQAQHWSNDRQILTQRPYLPLEVAEVRHQVEALRHEIQLYRTCLASSQTVYHELVYEDLFGEGVAAVDQQARLGQLFVFLGLPLPGDWAPLLRFLQPNPARLAGREQYLRVPHIQKIEAALAGGENGTLFG